MGCKPVQQCGPMHTHVQGAVQQGSLKQIAESTETMNYVLSLATFLFEHGHFQKKLQIENSIILLQRQFRKDFCHGIIHCI